MKMNVTVVGGNGYAGSAIAREAARRGHAVTAISRSLPDVKIDGVTYKTADVLEGSAPIDLVDVVVGALSPRGDSVGTLTRSYDRLAQQAREVGARLVLVGGFSCLRPSPGAPRMVEGSGFPPEVPQDIVREAKENMDVLNNLLNDNTTLDWLFVSPALEFSAWQPGQDLGRYRVGDDVALFDEAGHSAISGVDFARAVVDEIENPTRRRAQIGIAY
ncbi:NAD(P)H-binding protein [Paraburkholderia tropica]|uniref:NAD(P)-dependent oxidoreductase n=1 Tax=Paraburkholderia TaxID=1822464 RepID=UPI0032B390E8